MKRFTLTLVALLATSIANAQIYQWKDKSGKTIISDKPPVENVGQPQKIDVEPSTAKSLQKTTADLELEFRKRQKESQESAEKAKKNQAVAAENKESCNSARRSLQSLESGERIAMRDDKGERYFLEDEQRQQEIAKTRQFMQANCK